MFLVKEKRSIQKSALSDTLLICKTIVLMAQDGIGNNIKHLKLIKLPYIATLLNHSSGIKLCAKMSNQQVCLI